MYSTHAKMLLVHIKYIDIGFIISHSNDTIDEVRFTFAENSLLWLCNR